MVQGALFPFNPQICPLLSMLPVQHFFVPPGLLTQPLPPQLPQLFAQHIVSPVCLIAIPSYSSHGSEGALISHGTK